MQLSVIMFTTTLAVVFAGIFAMYRSQARV